MTSSSTPAQSATARVFAITELTEAILLDATSTNNYNAGISQNATFRYTQRALQAFDECIVSSPALQRRRLACETQVRTIITGQASPPQIGAFELTHHSGGYKCSPHPINGLTDFTYYNDSRPSDPHPVLFFGELVPYLLRKSLENSSTEWLDMFLELPQDNLVTLHIGSFTEKLKIGLDPYWWGSQVTVKNQKIGFLIGLAVALQEASEDLERITYWRNDFHSNRQAYEDFGELEPDEVFEWRKFFSREQLDVMVQEPEIVVR